MLHLRILALGFRIGVSVAACLITVIFVLPSCAISQNGPYTLTIFADQGSAPSAATTNRSSGSGSNLGHVFIELANGSNEAFIGYYGQPGTPARGQLRVDADLFRNGDYDVSKTYQITATGYLYAHQMIDVWGGHDGKKWGVYCNCSDFAQAVANAAQVDLADVPTEMNANLPYLWAQYLRSHGGTVNNRRRPSTGDGTAGSAQGILGTWEASSCGFSQALILTISQDSSGRIVGTMTAKDIVVSDNGCGDATYSGKVSQGIFHDATFAGNTLSFTTAIDGDSLNVSMTFAGRTLIYDSPGGRFVLRKTR
jgi:hypothetical protein